MSTDYARGVLEARDRIGNLLHRTPVITSRLLDEACGCSVVLKCENLQRTGSFKARGATNAVSQLAETGASSAVATHSSGNHGAALAWAATQAGMAAHVVVPNTANANKKSAMRAYGATVHECEPTMEARMATLERVLGETGAEVVPPFDDDRIICGQGTACLELLEQTTREPLDTILVPVGGGGLLAGTLIAAQLADLPRSPRVIGVEPALGDDMARSVRTGERMPSSNAPTVADGLRAGPGARNFSLVRERVDSLLSVSEAQIIAAMRLVWTRCKLVIEPSSAVPLAALLYSSDPELRRGRVGIIISGGNVDLDALPWSAR
ncbi:MAG: threonine ammonia-lyase [Gammaproteobacteria bacterium]